MSDTKCFVHYLSASSVPPSLIFLILVLTSLGCTLGFSANVYSVVENGRNFERIRIATSVSSVDGQTYVQTNYLTILGAGINVQRPNGTFEPSNTSFELTANGAEALGTFHRVKLAPNINSQGAVQIWSGTNFLQNHPLCLAYFDPDTGESVLLAELQDSVGTLISSNVVIYTNCFTDIKASMRYKNAPWGLEADVILHERPPNPSDFGFSARARLEVFTEFVNLQKEPLKGNKTYLERETNVTRRVQVVEPDFEDAPLGFSHNLRMIKGKAFSTKHREDLQKNRIPVGKRFQFIDERAILIEAINFQKAESLMLPLPAASTNASVNPRKYNIAKARQLSKEKAVASLGRSQIQIAQVPSTDVEGLVIDYVLITSTPLPSYNFRSDETYWITDFCEIRGKAIFEGGTVLKFDSWGTLQLNGAIECLGENYAPVFLTSKDDDSVGTVVPTSTGTPGEAVGWPALLVTGANPRLNNIRFSYLTNPLEVDGPTLEVRHSQFVNCELPFVLLFTQVKAYNNLFKNFYSIFDGVGFSVDVQHMTARQGQLLGRDFDFGSFVNIKNSLVADVLGSEVATTGGTWIPNEAGVFSSVGGSTSYLSQNSPYRLVGDINVDSLLQRELGTRTTTAPQILSGTLPARTTLMPIIPRFSKTQPDLGYHYPAVDFLLQNVILPAGTIQLTNGVVVAVKSNTSEPGIKHGHNAVLSSTGKPSFPNVFTLPQMFSDVIELLNNTPLISMAGTDSRLDLRFTSCFGPNFNQSLLNFGPSNPSAIVNHCEISGFRLTDSIGGSSAYLAVTNTLFDRSTISINNQGSGTEVYLYNNLFKVREFSLVGATLEWNIRDNAFDNVEFLASYGALNSSHNAYINSGSQLPGEGNITLAILDYLKGPFGRYYLPPNCPLIDGGSRSVPLSRLSHFTGVIDQRREINNVDIGLHYVRTAAFQSDFNSLVGNWLYVNEGNLDVPTGASLPNWKIEGGKLKQLSNIYGPDAGAVNNRKGTYFWNTSLGTSWTNYRGSFKVTPYDDDGIGMLLRYAAVGNSYSCYKLDLDNQRNFRKLFRIDAGVETLLASEVGGYLQGIDNSIEFQIFQSAITIRLNGETLFAGPVHDAAISQGAFAFYTWGSSGVEFDDILTERLSDIDPDVVLPTDSDLDRLADFLEDRTGDGTKQSNEANWFLADTDSDGWDDFMEISVGMNPNLNELTQSTPLRRVYELDLLNRLRKVTGNESITLIPDEEGNILSVSP